jgi:hypothetical protein
MNEVDNNLSDHAARDCAARPFANILLTATKQLLVTSTIFPCDEATFLVPSSLLRGLDRHIDG